MTTIEEIENEIAALKEALEIIEERTGDKLSSDNIKSAINANITSLDALRNSKLMDLPVHPYEPEFDKYSKWDR